MMATKTTCTFRDLIEYASKNFPEANALISNPNSYLFETRTVHFGSEHPIMVHTVVLATAADQAEPSHKLLAAFSAGAHAGFVYGSGHCTLTERELYEARDLDIGRLREPFCYLDISQSGSNLDLAEQFAMLSMLVQYSLLLTAKIRHSLNWMQSPQGLFQTTCEHIQGRQRVEGPKGAALRKGKLRPGAVSEGQPTADAAKRQVVLEGQAAARALSTQCDQSIQVDFQSATRKRGAAVLEDDLCVPKGECT